MVKSRPNQTATHINGHSIFHSQKGLEMQISLILFEFTKAPYEPLKRV